MQIDDSEFDKLAAGLVRVGETAHTGNVSLASAIDAAGTGNISLVTSGTIVDNNSGNDITETNLALRAANGITANITVSGVLAAQNTTSGNIVLAATGDVKTGSLDTLTGISNTGSGSVSLSSTGNINIGATISSSGANVTLSATNAIVDGGAAVDVSAATGTVSLTAGTGIGDGNAIETTAGTLSFENKTSGNVAIVETDSLSLSGKNSAEGGNVAVSLLTGNLTIDSNNLTTANGVLSLTADDMTITGTINTGSGNVALNPTTSARNINLGSTVGSSLSLDDAELDKITTTGTLLIGNNTHIGNISFGGNVDSSGSYTKLTLETTGAITDSNAAGVDLAVSELTLIAGTGIGAADPIEINVANLTASTTGTGNLSVVESDSVTLVNVKTTNGTITVEANGTITVDRVSAGPSGTSNVTLTATNGSILDGNVDAAIEANGFSLTAKNDVGNGTVALGTNVTSLTANITGTGLGNISETNAITLTSVTTTDGDFTLTANGTITATSVDSKSAKNISLTAKNGDIIAGNVATVGVGNVTLTATTGSILDDANTSTKISGNVLTLSAEDGIGNATVALSTDVSSLTANVTGTGLANISEASAVTLTSVKTTDGTIDITANGTITATLVQAVAAKTFN